MDIKYREDSHLLAWQFWIKQCCWLRQFFDECYGEIDFFGDIVCIICFRRVFLCYFCCLPLREGVDWNVTVRKFSVSVIVSLCVREWIETSVSCAGLQTLCRLPLREGVDWNAARRDRIRNWYYVSLCVREWIETPDERRSGSRAYCLPLREGVDWNSPCGCVFWRT